MSAVYVSGGTDENLPPLLPGSQWMEHDGRRRAIPPRPIGYEREQARLEAARKPLELEPDRLNGEWGIPIQTPTHTPTKYALSSLRPEAPAFTPSPPSKKPPTYLPTGLRGRCPDTNNMMSDSREMGRLVKIVEENNFSLTGNGLDLARPPSIAEKFRPLTGSKWEPPPSSTPSSVTPTKKEKGNVHQGSPVAIPRMFESSRKK